MGKKFHLMNCIGAHRPNDTAGKHCKVCKNGSPKPHDEANKMGNLDDSQKSQVKH